MSLAGERKFSAVALLVVSGRLVCNVIVGEASPDTCRLWRRPDANLACVFFSSRFLPSKFSGSYFPYLVDAHPKSGNLFTAICLIVLCAVPMYWFGYLLLRARLHKITEAMHSFVASGFQTQILVGMAGHGASVSLRTVLDPAREIDALTSNAELMASAIQDSRRRMIDRERNHLDWLAFLCHDLAVPLARVQARIEALQYDPDLTAEERNSALESLRTEVSYAIELIGSVKDFAQLESSVERRFETTSLDQILEQAMSSFEIVASQKCIELDLRIRPNVGKVAIQKTLIRRSVENLISNAIRFTPEGGLISVLLERSGDMALIRVTDTGTGIPEDELDRVFEFEFKGKRQISPSTIGSMGLGLALVKKVVEIHHGHVTAQNIEPHGAEFVVSLPIAKQQNGRSVSSPVQ